MDIIQILSAIKGKVLDVAHFELLKSAYELQNNNIEQLKNNNTALRESNDLLKEKNKNVGEENEMLRKRIVSLGKEIENKKNIDSSQKLSEVAETILRKCIQKDVTDFNDKEMIMSLSYSRIQSEAGIDELSNLNIIKLGSVSTMGGGANYYLTAEGKKFALKVK